MHPFLDLSPSEILCPPSPTPRPPLSLSLYYIILSLTSPTTAWSIVLFWWRYVILQWFHRAESLQHQFLPGVLLDVSMTWCSWRVTGDSATRDTCDLSRITTDHHTQVPFVSLMSMRFLWWCFHLFSPRMLLFFLIVFIDALLPLHGFWFFFFFFTQSFCAILVSVLFFFGWSGSFLCQQSVV